jgi:hypothetical protein
MSAPQPVSNWWYLLPIIFGIIGGIIAWFRFRKTDPNKARKFMITGLLLTLVFGVTGDYLLDPWLDELEQVNLWCAEQFDAAIADPVKYQDSTEMLDNYCFTNFEDWKYSSVSINDGTAEKVLNEKGTSISEVIQHNIKRESGLD